jgi:hypothetical protein
MAHMIKSRLKNALLAATASTVLLSAAEAHATVVLTFEGLQNQEEILNYYNAGLGSKNSGPGPNYGITFDSNGLASIENSQPGGTGNFSGEPSPHTAAFFGNATSGVMNVTSGFTDELSFYYSAVAPGSVTVWSGSGGTGTELASLSLLATQTFPPPSGTTTYHTWDPESVSFSGTAESVVFSGSGNQIGFDNVTVGAVPAPLVGHGLTGVLAVGGILFGAKLLERGRRRRLPGTA